MLSERQLRFLLRSDRRVALWSDLIRVAVGAIVVAVIALYLVYYAVLARFMVRELHMNDFGKFYYSARMFLDGQDMYGPSPATEIPVSKTETRQFWNMNPPHFQLVMLPLAMMPPTAALAVWWIIGLGCLSASVRIISREFAWKWTLARSLWLVLIVLVSAATGTVVITGQVTFLLVLPLTVAWRCARRGAWTRAAILLGVLASIKPFLGIFALLFAAQRRRFALLIMGATVVVVFAGGWVVAGTMPYTSWVRALGEVSWAWSPMNASLNGLFTRALDASPFFTPLSARPSWIPVAVLVGAAPVAILTVLVLLRDRSPVRIDRGFAGLSLASLLVSPLGWIYYAWLPAGPAAALVLARRVETPPVARRFVLLALPGLVCPLVFTIASGSSGWAGLTIGSIYFWSILSLWFAWLADARSSRRGQYAPRPLSTLKKVRPNT